MSAAAPGAAAAPGTTGQPAGPTTATATTKAATSSATSSITSTTTDPVLAVGGDIACTPGSTPTSTSCQQAATGKLLTQSVNPTVVLPLGDTQYEDGTPTEYAGSYNVVGWGADKGISRPAPGNHEYHTTGATGYYDYFGANAGDPTKGYYSYDIYGPNNAFHWHMIALNSECAVLGGGSISAGCGVGSTQEQWLKADLAAHPNLCTIAYWHRPRFSSSTTTPSSTTYVAFWNDLYAAGADIVLNGHAHDYERFAPQTSSGAADPTKGIREFIVGTGGDGFQTMGPAIANSVVRNANTFGVLKLTLHATSYDWQFIPANGGTFTDSGSASCHSASTVDTTPPTAPTGVTATASSANQVNLTWTASTDNVGVKNYNIYRGANGSTPTLLTTTTTSSTSYTDSAVTGSTAYTYQVQAIDAAGNVSTLSTAASVTTPPTPDTTPPTVPTNLQPEVVFYNEVDLGWSPSTDSGTGVSGYKVYRQMSGEPTPTLLATTVGSATSYVDLTVSPDTQYTYYVTAYDGAGNESGKSASITVHTPLGPPTTTYTFPASADSTIEAAYPTKNYGLATKLMVDNSPVDDFLLKFNVATSGCDTLSSATLQLTDAGDASTKGGDIYTTGPDWTERGVTYATAPARGTLLNSLGAVTSTGTYQVDVTPGVTTVNGEADFRVGTTSSNGAKYYSRQGGTTAQRPQLIVVCANATSPDNQPPTAPTNLAATAASSGEVDLTWSASTDNVAVTGYNIYRGGVQVGAVSASALSYQDITVAPGTTYTYTVRAVDAAGNSSGDSNQATVTTPTQSSAYTFTSTGDATIEASYPTKNYGRAAKLIVDGSPVDDFLLKFNVATSGCTKVDRATLQLTDYGDGSTKGGDIYVTSGGWSEKTVTYGTGPARSTLVNSLGPVVSGTTYQVDVTQGLATLNGEADFRVGTTSSNGAKYYSKEGGTGAQRPQLTVVCH